MAGRTVGVKTPWGYSAPEGVPGSRSYRLVEIPGGDLVPVLAPRPLPDDRLTKTLAADLAEERALRQAEAKRIRAASLPSEPPAEPSAA